MRNFLPPVAVLALLSSTQPAAAEPQANLEQSGNRIAAALERRLELKVGFGQVELEDGLAGASTRLGLGLDIGGALSVAVDFERIEFDGTRTDDRLGVETRYTFLNWHNLHQYASLRGFVAHRSRDELLTTTAGLGVGAQIGMGVELDLFGPLKGFAELGFGATAWNDPSLADRYEHFSGVMFGLRGAF